MTLWEDAVAFADGTEGIYSVVEKPDFALIIPLFSDGFQLVRQYRYPVQNRYWEFPQGAYEANPDLDPLDLAKQELREETGLVAGSIKKIGFLHEAYGYSNQGFHVFLARDLEMRDADREKTEQDMETKRVTFVEFAQLIEDGEITDAPTVSAFGLLKIKEIL